MREPIQCRTDFILQVWAMGAIEQWLPSPAKNKKAASGDDATFDSQLWIQDRISE